MRNSDLARRLASGVAWYRQTNSKYPLTMTLTLVVFFVLMSSVYGLVFGLALSLMLLVHEGGHMVALKRLGIPFSGAFFVPFMGAVISLKDREMSRAKEYLIAIGGPVGGIAFSCVTLMLWYVTDQPVFLAITTYLAAINLINMIPIPPLDGGRMTRAVIYSISRRLGHVYLVMAVIAGVALVLKTENPLMALLTFAAVAELDDEADNENNQKMSLLLAFFGGVGYLLTVGILAFLTFWPVTLPLFEAGSKALF